MYAILDSSLLQAVVNYREQILVRQKKAMVQDFVHNPELRIPGNLVFFQNYLLKS